MPHVHEIGPWFFTQFIRLNPGSPLVHTAPTVETEPPYRIGRSLVVRLWPATRAVVLGRWIDRHVSPDVAELKALRLLMQPRTTGPQDWCEQCGATVQCGCGREHDEDPGFCPRCLKLWEWCWCLDRLDEKYRRKEAS